MMRALARSHRHDATSRNYNDAMFVVRFAALIALAVWIGGMLAPIWLTGAVPLEADRTTQLLAVRAEIHGAAAAPVPAARRDRRSDDHRGHLRARRPRDVAGANGHQYRPRPRPSVVVRT